MSRERALRAAFAEALGESVADVDLSGVAGGCINQAATCEVTGQTWFVKWNDRPLTDQFAAEAAGLRALAEADCGLRIPRVLAHSDVPGAAFLILEHLPRGSRGPGFDEALGQGMAALHRATSGSGFGFACEGYCGATPQPNGWLTDWVEFYRERRLGHQLDLARARGFPAEAYRTGQRLLERLPEWIADDEPPALIHGDLWSGNLYVAEDGPALIDPAAYYGHREAELGMMSLFGGFSARVYAAYEEAYPLRAGWRERQGLYELYHVLNHFNLFGGGYGGQAARIMQRYVGG